MSYYQESYSRDRFRDNLARLKSCKLDRHVFVKVVRDEPDGTRTEFVCQSCSGVLRSSHFHFYRIGYQHGWEDAVKTHNPKNAHNSKRQSFVPHEKREQPEVVWTHPGDDSIYGRDD